MCEILRSSNGSKLRDGNTSGMLCTGLPFPSLARSQKSLQIGLKPMWWYQSLKQRDMRWPFIRPLPVNKTYRLFGPLDVRFIIGYRFAPRYSLYLGETPRNTKVMYDSIKQALRPTQKKTAPLKAITGKIILDWAKQMERWVEHYSELYARENMVSEEDLNACLCWMSWIGNTP